MFNLIIWLKKIFKLFIWLVGKIYKIIFNLIIWLEKMFKLFVWLVGKIHRLFLQTYLFYLKVKLFFIKLRFYLKVKMAYLNTLLVTQLVIINLIITYYLIIIFSIGNGMFQDHIKIEYHIDKTTLIVTCLILLISFIGIIFGIIWGLSKIFKEKKVLMGLRVLIGMLISTIFLNIYTISKIFNTIVDFRDIIYKGDYFTIYYIYTRDDLLALILPLYRHLIRKHRVFTPEEKDFILDQAQNIAELKQNILKFHAIKPRSTFSILSDSIYSGIEVLNSYPFVTTAIIGGIATIIASRIL